MQLQNVTPSVNFEDRTSWSTLQHVAQKVANDFNPVYAVRNLRGALSGEAPKPVTMQLGMPTSQQ